MSCRQIDNNYISRLRTIEQRSMQEQGNEEHFLQSWKVCPLCDGIAFIYSQLSRIGLFKFLTCNFYSKLQVIVKLTSKKLLLFSDGSFLNNWLEKYVLSFPLQIDSLVRLKELVIRVDRRIFRSLNVSLPYFNCGIFLSFQFNVQSEESMRRKTILSSQFKQQCFWRPMQRNVQVFGSSLRLQRRKNTWCRNQTT